MMVSAFGGHDLIMGAYEEAVKEKYKFFSHGTLCSFYKRETLLYNSCWGSGSRMGTSTPKQFLKLNEKPILIHTVESTDFDNNAHFIIALPFSEFDYWRQLCKHHNLKIPHQLSKGGNNRFELLKTHLAKSAKKASFAFMMVCAH